MGYTKKKHSILSRFVHCQRGVTAIEFAFVAPALLLLVTAILEVSLILFALSTLEGAAFMASRTGKTGYIATESTREETIRTILDQKMEALFDTQKITIQSLTYNQFDQIGEVEPFVDVNNNGVRDENENYTDVNGNGQYDLDMGMAGVGNTSQIVVYTINYPWPVTTPMMNQWIGENGIINLTARAITQNEPF
ncbi:MAG: TadE/TadG family type IV pilus assembly protein [Rickettsiales bacterium]|nr:TadE/TadG family type IV pilus assembly protein [Rickettsiales bacterium]